MCIQIAFAKYFNSSLKEKNHRKQQQNEVEILVVT